MEYFESRISWLNCQLSQPAICAISNQIRDVIIQSSKHSTIPARLLDTLVFDLMYAILRNHKWLSVSVFREALIDHIASQYAFSSEFTDELIASVLSSYQRDYPTSDLQQADDREFIRYMIVGRRLALIPDDLGFGANLFEKIERSERFTKKLRDGTDQNDSACFLPAIDTQIIESIIDIDQAIEDSPNYLLHSYLQTLLSKAKVEDRVFLNQVGFDGMLRIIASIGTKRSMSLQAISKLLADPKDTDQLIDSMSHAGLIFIIEQSKVRERVIVGLTELGYQVSADYFGSRHQFEGAESLARLPAHYQVAAIASLSLDETEELYKSMQKSRAHLTSESYFRILQGTTQKLPLQDVLAWCMQQIEPLKEGSSSSVNLQKAIVRFLHKHTSAADVRHVLQNVAESSPINSVQDLALDGLVNGTTEFSSTRY